ncbi:MAG TPA: hypothetical protein ACN46U_04615 [Prochlorococcus sp.]
MTRSRAFNRSHRFTAKKRRHALRAAIPDLNLGTNQARKSVDHSQELRQQAWQKDLMLELIEPHEAC